MSVEGLASGGDMRTVKLSARISITTLLSFLAHSHICPLSDCCPFQNSPSVINESHRDPKIKEEKECGSVGVRVLVL